MRYALTPTITLLFQIVHYCKTILNSINLTLNKRQNIVSVNFDSYRSSQFVILINDLLLTVQDIVYRGEMKARCNNIYPSSGRLINMNYFIYRKL